MNRSSFYLKQLLQQNLIAIPIYQKIHTKIQMPIFILFTSTGVLFIFNSCCTYCFTEKYSPQITEKFINNNVNT